jgi:hypothetical protein
MPSPSPILSSFIPREMVEELGAGIGIDCPLAGGISLDTSILRWRLDSSVAVVTRIQAGVNESGRERGMFFRGSVPNLGHTQPSFRQGLFYLEVKYPVCDTDHPVLRAKNEWI